MVVQIIGYWCLIQAIVTEIAICASVVQKDEVKDGSRAKANFIAIANLAVAVWCFK